MNNIYRLVWNSASRVWVVASELASAKGKGKTHPKRLAIKVGSALGVALVGFTTIDSARAWIVDPNYVLNDGTAIQAPVDGGSIYNIAIGTEAVANRTDDPTRNRGAIAIGFRAKATHTDAIAVGMDAKAESYGSTAFGPASKITGTNSGNSIAFGNHANVQENSYGALAMGAGTTVSGINATSIGANAYSNGAGAAAVGYLSRAVGENSVVLGYKAETAAANAIAIGGTSLATADSALAIGNNAKASLIGALALGSESNSDTESGIIGYAPTNSSSDSKDAVSKTVSTRAAVSVGDTDAGILRQITDVAAGTANTDAVNVAQLKALENTPLIFAGNTGVSSKILGETVTIKGGGITSGSYSDANLKTEVDAEGNINLKIADNPTFNSLLVGGNTKVDSSGLTITDGPSVLKTGINAANQKITNVAAGALTDTSTDAV
ncbi:TPA: hypothetical protein JAX37_004777, partial [Enterobacter cloacae]|nr:hypothetical protein [Enterobacter cloacae]